MNLKEIEKRMKEIEEELKKDNVDLEALEKEVDALKEEKAKLTTNIQKRETLLNKVSNYTAGTVVESRDMVDRMAQERKLSKEELKEAFAKRVLGRELNEIESRALGVALTTTSTTFTAPTSTVDGINNGGVFIPQELLLDILREIELESPFLMDCKITAIAGMVKSPYAVSLGGANNKAEGTENEDESNEYRNLELQLSNITKTIPVTFELEAVAVAEFADYLLEEIGIAMREQLAEDALYGTGTNNTMTGATVGAIIAVTDGYEAGKGLEALEAAIKKIPKRAKAGAKIYMSTELYNDITFAKDSNGAYLYNPINGNAINKIAITVVEEPFLKDGDFIIGNPAKNMKINMAKPMEVYRDVYGKKRITEYSAHMMAYGAPKPNTFVYGAKAEG